MNASVYTIHQAKYVNDRLSEVVVLCRDEPEPESPIFFYEETVLPVEKVIEYMLLGDLFYAQWGENCFNIEIIKLENGEESIEVVPNELSEDFSSLAKLPSIDEFFI
ncbi:hypothetical protein [Undibacterium sp.]|uniref:hypothetical protein n=1 Tax=Undibacterium sp. TaxID=1914977 RepID=UPI0037521FF1